jgi:hypothetical protein
MTTPAQDFSGNLSKPKSFWGRPEGKTGLFFMLAILAGLGFVLVKFLPQIVAFASSLLGLVVTLYWYSARSSTWSSILRCGPW